MARSENLNVCFPADMRQALQEAADSEGVSVATVVRRAVRWELTRVRELRADRETPRRAAQPRQLEATA